MVASIDSDTLGTLGLRSTQDTQTSSKEKAKLGQDAFMELMIAQLRNQDPMKPMENGEFLTQIAQFSQVSGMQELQDSFKSLSESLVSNQALQAASLVGRDVLAPTGLGVLASGQPIHGSVELPAASSRVTVNIYDSAGQKVRGLELGNQAAGAAMYQWDGLRDDGTYAPPGNYLISAQAEFNGTSEAVEALVVNRVDGVTLSRSGGLLLDLAGVGPVDFEQVKQIL
ncbi:MAG: flagellar hook assembly protein FlgD [Gammaproteobacteria bacterium]|nr:flagellar hook assembly protein FlgD [Gammaproteobacteria bacterium]